MWSGDVPNGCSWITWLRMIFVGTCAKLCHVNGGEIEQIQFLLGHASVLTTERYLGCKQDLEKPVNDRFGCLFADRTVELR